MLLLPPTNTLSSVSLPNKEVTQADVNEVDTSSYLRSTSMQAADAHQLAINRDDCEQVMDIAVASSMVGSGGQTGMAGLGHGETLDMHNYCTGCAAPGVGGGGTFEEMEMVVEDQLCFGVVECLALEIHLQQLEMDQLIATHVVISSPLSIFSFVIMFCFLFLQVDEIDLNSNNILCRLILCLFIRLV